MFWRDRNYETPEDEFLKMARLVSASEMIVPSKFRDMCNIFYFSRRRDVSRDAEFMKVFREFTFWISSLQGNKPSIRKWDERFLTFSNAFTSADKRQKTSQPIEKIQVQVRRKFVKNVSIVPALDKESMDMLISNFEKVLDPLLKQKNVSLYDFGKHLESINFPRILSYENGMMGNFIDDPKHPFWQAFSALINIKYSHKMLTFGTKWGMRTISI